MRFIRFGAGIVVGVALGTAVPLMAQVGWPYLLGPTLSNQAYGVPSGVRVLLGCSNASGFLAQNSVAEVETIPSAIGGVPYTLAAVSCR